MSLIELPRDTWTAAFNDLSTAHEGWLVSVEVWTPEVGALPEIDALPLIGVTADRNDDSVITITAQAGGTAHASHVVRHAIAVTIERDDNGVAMAMHVESAGGVKTTVRFAVPPARVL